MSFLSNKFNFSKRQLILITTAVIILIFTVSLVTGNVIVRKDELEFKVSKQTGEANAKEYSLKEINSTTGEIRWQLTAKEGKTQDELNSAVIKDIEANLYKNKKILFKLKAPYGKANSSTKEIYLFGGVTVKDTTGNFFLTSNELDLGNGTVIEAKKGFTITFSDKSTINGESALINGDQTEIKVKNLNKAVFKDLTARGTEVLIERNNSLAIKKIVITQGGDISLNNLYGSMLSGDIINWSWEGKIKADGNVIYISQDKTFKANHLLITPEKQIYANGNVEINHGDITCVGKSLSYETKDKIVIEGKPKAIQNGREISADKIVYDLQSKTVEAIGNVSSKVIRKV